MEPTDFLNFELDLDYADSNIIETILKADWRIDGVTQKLKVLEVRKR